MTAVNIALALLNLAFFLWGTIGASQEQRRIILPIASLIAFVWVFSVLILLAVAGKLEGMCAKAAPTLPVASELADPVE